MNNATTHAVGTKGTFTNPELPKMGAMTGAIEEDDIFMPDQKYHDKLFKLYGVEGEEGLFLDQGTFTPRE